MHIFRKYILLSIVAIALFCNSVLLFPISENKKETAYSELKKILGETVIICSNSNSQKYYLSSFDRLDEEQKQHLENLDNIKKNTNNADNDRDIVEFFVSLNLKHLSEKIFESEALSDSFLSQSQFSRAPPALS